MKINPVMESKMIQICKLTKRQVNPSTKRMSKQLEQVKVFSMAVGHGVGTIDFVECVATIEENEYLEIVKECGPYAQFKLGNLSRYFEIEIFPEHVAQLLPQMPNSTLKNIFLSLSEGYIVVRKPL